MKLAIRAGLSVLVLGALFWWLPWGEFTSAFGRLSPVIWLGVLAGFLAGHRLGVTKWRRMVNAGRAHLESADGLRCYAAGLFANLCLPSIVGGDVLRAALAARATGRREAAVIGSIADRLSDVAALGVITLTGALLVRTELPGWGPQVVAVLSVAGLVGAALFVPLALRRPLARWPKKLRRTVGRALVALRRLSRAPRTALLVFGLSLTIQSVFVLLNAWIGRSIGIDLPIAAWFFAWPVAKVAGLLPISLGGLGVRDATFGAALATFGVPLAEGVAASLIWQTVLIAGGLVAGGVWWSTGRSAGSASGRTAAGPLMRPARRAGG